MKGIFQRAFSTMAFSIAFFLAGVLLVFSAGIILGPIAKSVKTRPAEPIATNPVFIQNTSENTANWNGSIPPTDDEFVGPFKSWLNAQTGFGAKGDGVTDDTRALQAAFDAAAKGDSCGTLFLPKGVYLITGTLTLSHHIYVNIIGADPRTTIIKWGGAAHGTMMQNNGTAYSKFDRITWNGAGIADIAVDQSWDGKAPHFDTGNEYADDVFVDVGFGLRGGALGHGFAETSILRDQFIRNNIAGISLGNFNALDIWIRNCIFQDCVTGVTNTHGAGNFRLYNNIFRNSTDADISLTNTGTYSIRGNTSVNSNRFFFAGFSSNPCQTTITDNVIIDPVSSQAITVSNQGPVIFINNTIRSLALANQGPVASIKGNHNSELIAIGNKFTVANPVLANDTKIEYNDTVVSRISLAGLKEPVLPGVEPNFDRKIFEIPRGADAAIIQSVINEASKFSGKRPVVHLPYGRYKISSTILFPANSDIQFIGDGYGEDHSSMLIWNGTGADPIISITGPSKVTLRDFTFNGNKATTNLLITNTDQKGSRVFLQEVNKKGGKLGLLVNQLDNLLLFGYDTQFSGLKKAINVVGGPLAAKGTPAEGRTIIYSGAESDNNLSHEVTKGGNLLIQDSWYEGGGKSTYVNLSGSGIFTAAGNHISGPQNTDVPMVLINNFSGKASFLSSDLWDRISINGDGSKTKLLALGILTETFPFVADTSLPKAEIRTLLNRTRSRNSSLSHSGSDSIPDIGNYNSAFLADMMSNMLNVHPIVLTPLSPNVSDIRLYRVMIVGGGTGIDVEPGNAVANNIPTALAGIDKSTTVSTGETLLSGSGLSPEGKIVSYKWVQAFGPKGPKIVSQASAETKITGLSIPGSFIFRLTVIDDSGASANSDVKVIVTKN